MPSATYKPTVASTIEFKCDDPLRSPSKRYVKTPSHEVQQEIPRFSDPARLSASLIFLHCPAFLALDFLCLIRTLLGESATVGLGVSLLLASTRSFQLLKREGPVRSRESVLCGSTLIRGGDCFSQRR